MSSTGVHAREKIVNRDFRVATNIRRCAMLKKNRGADAIQLCGTPSNARGVAGEAQSDSSRPVEKDCGAPAGGQ